MRVAVTGGVGKLGKWVVRELRDASAGRRARTWPRYALLLLAVACTPPAAPSGPVSAAPTSSGAAPAATTATGPTQPAPAGQGSSATTATVQPTPLPRRAVLTAYPAVSLSAMSYM